MNEPEKDTQMRKPGRPLKKEEPIKLILVAQLGNRKVQTIKLSHIYDLRLKKWDGYRIVELKIYCELTTTEEAETIIEFLKIHKYCLSHEANSN